MSPSDSRRNSTMRAVATKSSLRNAFVSVFFSALLFCVSVAPAMAQSTASLNGTVTDPSGAAVPNAKVAVTNAATGIASTTQTDSAGAYLFPSLPIGTYRIEVTASGFQSAAISDLKLPVATDITQNIQLKIVQASNQVELDAYNASSVLTPTSMATV